MERPPGRPPKTNQEASAGFCSAPSIPSSANNGYDRPGFRGPNHDTDNRRRARENRFPGV